MTVTMDTNSTQQFDKRRTQARPRQFIIRLIALSVICCWIGDCFRSTQPSCRYRYLWIPVLRHARSFPLAQHYVHRYHNRSRVTQQLQILKMSRTKSPSGAFRSFSSRRHSSKSTVHATNSMNKLQETTSTSCKRKRPFCNDATANEEHPEDTDQQHQSMTTNMMTMSVVGTLLTIGIVLTLAGNGNDFSDEGMTRNLMVASSAESDAAYSVVPYATKSFMTLFQQRMIEPLEIAGTNIVGATVPLTASDIVSVAIGESIAGVIGASLSYIISNLFVGFVRNKQPRENEEPGVGIGNRDRSSLITGSYNNLFPNTASTGIVKMSDAMADTDYIITNVAAKEILSSSLTFLSPIVRTLIATGIAIIPYSIVKYNAQKQRQKDILRQQQLIQQLIQEEDELRQQQIANIQLGNIWKQIENRIPLFSPTTTSKTPIPKGFNDKKVVQQPLPSFSPYRLSSKQLLDTFASSTGTTGMEFDWVEIFSDIVKWLQFDILCTDFGNGQLLGSLKIFRVFVAESMLSQEQYVSLLVGSECAIFGIITAITSQMYSDVLYSYFKLGAASKQAAIRNRTGLDWYTIYLSKIIYCAVLFGIYGALKEPTESIVIAVGSGGADNCYGSINYQYCIDTFVSNNPVGPTPEAQLRSLITAGISFWNNHFRWLSYRSIVGPS